MSLAIGLALLLPAPAAAPALPNGCSHVHRRGHSYRMVRRLVRHYRPEVERDRVRHWIRCTRDHRAVVRRKARAYWDWRHSYGPSWRIRFNRLPASWQNWAYATGACESGNNPATNTGNSFSGAFQFLPSTWWAAGGTGYPHQHSWHAQAVIAVRWRMRSSQSQWPNCAPW
jgi:hypothetical protein